MSFSIKVRRPSKEKFSIKMDERENDLVLGLLVGLVVLLVVRLVLVFLLITFSVKCTVAILKLLCEVLVSVYIKATLIFDEVVNTIHTLHLKLVNAGLPEWLSRTIVYCMYFICILFCISQLLVFYAIFHVHVTCSMYLENKFPYNHTLCSELGFKSSPTSSSA